MKAIWTIVGCCLLCFSNHHFYAQDIRINKNDLPYCIPIVQNSSHATDISYQWLENGEVIENANDYVYIIPPDKSVGTYVYTHRVRGVGCPDWLSSNSVSIEIYADSISGVLDPNNAFRVKFSPQRELSGYLEELIDLIDYSQEQLDISIYSIDNYDVQLALGKAVDRGVQVRMLYEGASSDRKSSWGTISHQLEELGIDVKYVNKTNHHKFIISDSKQLMTSSGNWNSRANWKYDDSVLITEVPDVVLRYRAEFELLWNNSREFGKSFKYSLISPDSLLNSTMHNADIAILFTSSNYRVSNSAAHGPTFSKHGDQQHLADKIVEQINAASKSIRIAANYLRSRPICEALIAKKNQYPNMDIKVFTDQNEHITESFNSHQKQQRENCLTGANTPAKLRDCLEKNFLYSYDLEASGIAVRFKTYSHKWHHSTANVMHHKYAIFDEDVVAVGSYNYSYNSETNCMENLVVFNRKAAPDVVATYVSNFEELWQLGRKENYYSDLLQFLGTSNRLIPLIYIPVSLSREEYSSLKERIERAVPAVRHPYFKKNGHKYTSYLKGVMLGYGMEDQLITKMEDYFDQQFVLEYDYNENKDLTSSSYRTKEGLVYNNYYTYNKQLTKVENEAFTAVMTYDDKLLNAIDLGRGKHTWSFDKSADNSYVITYNKPKRDAYSITKWTDYRYPMALNDLEDRFIQWSYDANHAISAISSSDRNIIFSNSYNWFSAVVDRGAGFEMSVQNLDKFTINTTGEVDATIYYHRQQRGERETSLSIDVLSNKVSSGQGRMAHIEYVLDAYGREIQSGNLRIKRRPYSGEVIELKNKNISESRTYNAWSLLAKKVIKYQKDEIYKAVYHYDGMHRIHRLDEIVLGDTAAFLYKYNSRGQLEQVLKNGRVSEHYQYDNFGNRTEVNYEGENHRYTYNAFNGLSNRRWQLEGVLKERKFKYNRAGQLSLSTQKSNSFIDHVMNFNYDVFGNLLTVIGDQQTMAYSYDAFDRRITSYVNGIVSRKWVYGSGELPIASYNQEDRIVETYIYIDRNKAILMRKGSIDYYLVTDIRGSVRMVVDSENGSLYQQLDYDAFGRLVRDSNPGFTPFGYAGGFYDYNLGFLRFGNRDYWAEMGQWTTENNWSFISGGFNDYAYSGNNPINLTTQNGILENAMNGSSAVRKFQGFRIFKNAVGAAGKSRTWNQLGKQFPLDISTNNRPDIYTMTNRVYSCCTYGLHPKIDAYKESRTYNYKPENIRTWMVF